MINKKQLFKRAWDLAKSYSRFPKRAFRDGVPIDPNQQYENGGLIEIHPSPFVLGYQVKLKIRRSIYGAKRYFKYALGIIWRNMKTEGIEFQRQKKKEKLAGRVAKTQQNVSRELVAVGEYEVGDKLCGHIITGFGKIFEPNVDMFSQGISPDTEHAQYAYFN